MAGRRSFRGFRVRSAVLGALLIMEAAAGPVRAASPATFVVTTASDAGGSTCVATCSFRQAISAANANSPATDLIQFNVPGGPATINVGSALPDIIDTVVIDGTTQPGTKLRGASAGPSANGLHVLASGTVVKGLDIQGFGGDGIRLDGVHDTLVGGGSAAEGNILAANRGDGVAVVGTETAIGNLINSNRIFGNGSLAIDLADDNRLGVVGNSIGGPPHGPNDFANGPILAAPLMAPLSVVSVQLGRADGTGGSADIFWSPDCPLDPAGSGYQVPQAAEFLGNLALGTGPADFTLPTPRSTGYITATSTALYGTSEISQCSIIAAPTDLSASVAVTPTVPVDVGTPVHIDLTITNLGPADHSDPVALVELTGGSAVATGLSSTQGSCETIEPDSLCQLGALGSGANGILHLDLVPTVTGTIDLLVGVGDISGLDPNPANDTTTVSIIVLAAESTSGTVSGGQSVSTDANENDGATLTDPIETSVTLPPGAPSGTITIAERPDATQPPVGYQFFGQASVITAPPQTAAHPLVFQFTLDGSIIPTTPLVIFRNNVPVPPCTVANPGSDPSATPDPCYLPPAMSGDDLVVTVRTSQASTWRVGTRSPFTFTGFFAPVDNGGVLNQVKAGQAIPVKFSLGGDKGLNIFVRGSPSSAGIACGSARVDPVEQTVTAGGSALTYDAASGRYQYVWKSDKAWAGTCRQLTLAFGDGSTATALFSFTK